jgi:hypothetical protein
MRERLPVEIEEELPAEIPSPEVEPEDPPAEYMGF